MMGYVPPVPPGWRALAEAVRELDLPPEIATAKRLARELALSEPRAAELIAFAESLVVPGRPRLMDQLMAAIQANTAAAQENARAQAELHLTNLREFMAS